jgi:hypothetical protein
MLSLTTPSFAESIYGQVKEDRDGNGQITRGELGIPNYTVSIQRIDGTKDRWAIADAEGRFRLDDLPAGKYRVFPNIPEEVTTTIPSKAIAYVTLPTTTPRPVTFALHKRCIEVKPSSTLVQGTTKADCFTWEFTFKNVSTFPIGEIYFNATSPVYVTDPLNPIAFNHVSFPTPLGPGKSTTLKLLVCGLSKGECIKLPILVYEPRMEMCCPETLNFCAPKEVCFNLFESNLKCRTKGGYTWTFCVQNLSGATVDRILVGGIRDAAGKLVSNTYPSNIAVVPTLSNGASACYTVTIQGAPNGIDVTVPISLYTTKGECCGQVFYLKLPNCSDAMLCPAVDASLKPDYRNLENGWADFSGRVAAITRAGFGVDSYNNAYDDPNDYVLQYLNISGYPYGGFENFPIWYVNGHQVATLMNSYNGPPDPSNPGYDLWTQRNLGHIFGLTIGPRGDAYVTHFGMYPHASTPLVPMGSKANRFGSVFKVDGSSGQISVVAELPNNQTVRPGLGNITYDYDHNLLFVTNFDNGMIYRVDPNNPTSYGYSWSPLEAWAPFSANKNRSSDSKLGWAPEGERVFGIQYHCGRLYFAKWATNIANENNLINDWNASANGTPTANTIFSVEVGPTGYIIQSTLRAEPGNPGGGMNPVSDISFSKEGYMGTAEMTITGSFPTTSLVKYSHASEATEYHIVNGAWVEKDYYVAGGFEHNSNFSNPPYYSNPLANHYGRGDCQGGVDYDLFNGDGWVWFTMANARSISATLPHPSTSAYGLVAYVPQIKGDPYWPNYGLNPQSPIVIDYDQKVGWGPKRYFGDVEIPMTVRY